MNMITIDKGVAMPGVRQRYPFLSMEVGDSFFFSIDEKSPLIDRAKLSNAASYYGRRHNRKFAVRKVEGGFRVWRIA